MIRRRLSEDLAAAHDAFLAVLQELEPAKAALPEAMPTVRLPGRQLPDAILAFEDGLTRAAARMPEWRLPELESAWLACDEALAEARRRATRLREDAPDLGGVEGLIWAIGQLLDPLDAFAIAQARFRRLRTRPLRSRAPVRGWDRTE